MTNVQVYCPFHSNMDTPAMSIAKDSGLYLCFNADCGAKGTLLDLVMKTRGLDHFGAKRLIIKKAGETVQQTIANKAKPKFVQKPLDIEIVDRLHKELLNSKKAMEYMAGRGFEEETLRHFKIGYSEKQGDLICVPAFNVQNEPIGLVGRSIDGKRFKNSPGFSTGHAVWNINNAVRCIGGTVIIVESTFDAMMLYQYGYANGVAIMGSNYSSAHFELINRNFESIIIATDADKAGRKAGNVIAGLHTNKRVRWASYTEKTVYPDNKKDICDMTESEVVECINNAVSNFKYNSWHLEFA